jgi:hypothetical protein
LPAVNPLMPAPMMAVRGRDRSTVGTLTAGLTYVNEF